MEEVHRVDLNVGRDWRQNKVAVLEAVHYWHDARHGSLS